MTVNPEDFGRDHWQTFGYLASCVVGAAGIPDNRKMRCDPELHPGFTGMIGQGRQVLRQFPPSPTRLSRGREVPASVKHDDWSCADDLEAAGFLTSAGTGIAPVYDLTDAGWTMLRELLAWNRQGGNFATFRPGGAS